MYRLEKFYAKDYNPHIFWEDKYAGEHIAGKNASEYSKQGFWPLLQKYIEKGKYYLDAGCGVGGWMLFLKDEGYHVAGIDIAARAVRAMTEYDTDADIKIASITEIPYADETFDGVLAIGTLEYVENHVEDALREVNRVSKKGGIFFIEVPIANFLRRLLYLPLKRIERFIKTGRGEQLTFSCYLFVPGEVRTMLDEAGFEVVEIAPHELPEEKCHYGLYVDWPFFRGSKPYELNLVGLVVKRMVNALSPWIASTGMVIVAKKR